MKITRSLLDLAVLSLASTVCAAPATPSSDALGTPDIMPHFQIDLTAVPSQLSARDTDVTVDHSLETHNFFGSEEWAVAIRPGVGPVWIHESRWSTLLDGMPASSDVESEAGNANATSIEARQYWGGYGYGYGSYYPYYGYGHGYGYYAKRDAEKRWTCPAQWTESSGCNSVPGLNNEATMFPFNPQSNPKYAPKMNVYYDTGCGSFMTSVIGSASCLIAPNQIHGIRTFNQLL
ncbi:uncharacterized protein ACLA_078140 [Aspergillus clavatus NRRL 1]|uniref:Uncharacterized protein n=1 Tax=Aspergillus clavatus (strain ATCC 1007 / CBS 513.65 / DSM 816 / NCTC 3887 / NRRL 1 / QM 1276 / 107) TaxID=344612 RepID=A1CLT7_ASPCL|nr:uncharacterized protein ACLA_078140 [Aspergillus clavatus NRRL 1]EAW09066.1 hypothetical protein ACLA_078140 [Aspergillus clavatus NRRL 1]